MKKILLPTLGILTFISSTALAGPYVGASLGLAIVHDSDVQVSGFSGTATANYDAGFGFNLAVGQKFEPLRVEGEFGFKKADLSSLSGPGGSVNVNDSDLTVTSYMVNAYYDFKADTFPIKPFVGVGLGLLHGELSVPGENDSDNQFGYQFTVGASYPVDQAINMDLLYRYQGSASDFAANGVSVSYGSSSIMAGIRYNF
ncbi:outer membrane beta-barrel protein [Geomonas sp. Red32]|uniref:outer membrane protein n=1 Tax=Geomonas sp. Red32 TaxID=2912856 RepID=UPI00202CDEC8|nr:outer membrane beta-barrel protein [Geomonas sp. Red32]MCM0080841.1 outer membrane beta-barrel protein [Geomonas sp. Red32]